MRIRPPSTILVVLGLLVLGLAQAQTLRYFSWEPGIAEETAALIAEFEAMHDGVTIEYEALPPEQYWPRMSALAASNRLPDVFYMSSGFIAEWQSNGLLANLQGYVNEMDLSEYFAGVLSTARFPDAETGDVHAIPINWVGPVLYYNQDMFDAAGLAYPSEGWTWDDFLNSAKELTIDTNGDGRTDQWGFWHYGRYAHIEPWIFQNGGHILNDARTRVEVDAGAREALEFLSDLTNVHQVSPPPREMEGVRQQDVFPLGLAAMWVDGSWNIANNRTVASEDMTWNIAMVPRGPSATEDIAYTWPDMLAIAETSEIKDLAFEFVEFMTGESRPAETFLGGTVPFYAPTAQSEAWQEPGQQPADKDVILELGNLPSRTSFTPNWSEWRGYGAAEGGGMNGELDQVFNGQKSIDEAIDTFEAFANEVLERVYPNP